MNILFAKSVPIILFHIHIHDGNTKHKHNIADSVIAKGGVNGEAKKFTESNL